MAYFIFTKNTGPGNLYRIAANDADKDALHFPPEHSIVKDVSDEDFLKIKSQKAEVYLDGDNVVIQDENSGSVYYEQASHLQEIIDMHLKICNEFIKDDRNQDSTLLSRVTSYRDMCESFDTSTVTFPMYKSWEAYLTDNSIDFISPLQFS